MWRGQNMAQWTKCGAPKDPGLVRFYARCIAMQNFASILHRASGKIEQNRAFLHRAMQNFASICIVHRANRGNFASICIGHRANSRKSPTLKIWSQKLKETSNNASTFDFQSI